MTQHRQVRIELAARSYDIHIASGLLAEAGARLRTCIDASRVMVITDTYVASHYLSPLLRSLEAAGFTCQTITLPAGEETKSYAVLQSLLEELLSYGVDRKTVLVALGGGVIGDITGFAASILLRGIEFVHMPTTLLAQVDSSVGGKTGINSPHGKNLIGSFHQPRLVLADTSTLTTLPAREWNAGYAEIVKYGIIQDAHFFAWLETHGPRAQKGDQEALADMIYTSCLAKAGIVAMDEREMGQRAILNFGHTLGHALEAETGFSDRLLHGEAVAIGMVLAMQLAVQRGICPKEDAARVSQHLQVMGLPVSVRDKGIQCEPQVLIAHCRKDKKAIAGALTFILPRRIGEVYIARDVTQQELETLLAHSV